MSRPPFGAKYLSLSYCQLLNQELVSSLPSLKRIHARIITHGLSTHRPLPTKLLQLAVSLSSSMHYAHQLFDTMPERDSFAWNTLIRGYADMGPCHAVPLLYKQMHCSRIPPDHYTFPFVIRSCAVISALKIGKMTHCNIIKYGFSLDPFVQTSLITMYSQNGEAVDSELVFSEMSEKNVVSWTAMISAYSQNCFYEKALVIFHEMLNSGVLPNDITLVSVLPCLHGTEHLNLGEGLHALAVKSGMVAYQATANALVAMYAKCGKLKVAKYLFDKMPVRDKVSWNTMIAMYEQNDDASEAVTLFRRMLAMKVSFDCSTLVSVLSACSSLGSLEIGKWVHDLAKNNGLDTDVRVGNILIDMYSKCGRIDLAREIFDKMPIRGVISWTAMVNAYANHGQPNEVLNMFHLMINAGIRPNSFTFLVVLVACGHSGLVDEGLNHFNSMRKDYSIPPRLEHCACVVDMLGRAGKISEAYDFIKKMDMNPDRGVWGALLGACRMHGRLDLAEFVARDLLKSGYHDVTYYILLINMYGDVGRWQDAEALRKAMQEMELKKMAAHSLASVERKLQTAKL
ncbi:Pentatricopeptide repeat-containing protein [Rhynchospora pubera]|uniref:Pentatricopeptide repeat-containing protein n=1 Tax=Rhynchospora pubera TaxID=906938 RepID=A0AAV8D324_9POAL|nr:Pentatricopeptide repeat-containing protein [Rhynchospora pubera]